MAITAHTDFARRTLEQISIDDHCYAPSCGSSRSTVAPSEIGSTHSSSPRQEQVLQDAEKNVCGALAIQTMVIADEPLQDMFADSDDDANPTSPSKSARRRLRRKRQRDALRAAADGSKMERSEVECAGDPRSPTEVLGQNGLEVDARCSTALDACGAHFSTQAPSPYRAPINSLDSPTSSPVRTSIMSTSSCTPASLASPMADASMRPVPPRPPMSTCPRSPISMTSPSADASTRPVPPRTPGNANCSCNMTPLGTAGVCLVILSPNTSMTPTSAISHSASTPVSMDRTVTPVAAELPPMPMTNIESPNMPEMPEMLKMLAGTTRVPTWGEIAYKLQTAAPEIYED